MKMTSEMTGQYAVGAGDQIQSKRAGYTAVVISSQEFSNGRIYHCVRTDNGSECFLKATEFTLIEKFVSAVPTGGLGLFDVVSDETIERTKNWREGEVAADKR